MWDHLSEPGNLIRWAAQFDMNLTMDDFDGHDLNNGGNRNEAGVIQGNNSGSLQDDLFYPLDCAFFDDDTMYPNGAVSCQIDQYSC